MGGGAREHNHPLRFIILRGVGGPGRRAGGRGGGPNLAGDGGGGAAGGVGGGRERARGRRGPGRRVGVGEMVGTLPAPLLPLED